MSSTQIRNARVVSDGEVRELNILIEDQIISKIEGTEHQRVADQIIDAKGQLLLPGAIDDQVHFREPGLTHKGNIATESKAALAGGITSFMEMPNTNPNTITRSEIDNKLEIGAQTSWANYSFFIGATNGNLDELKTIDYSDIPGVKIFMGSSTGNLLVSNEEALENIFKEINVLIATHCEDNSIIKTNLEYYKKKYGEDIPIELHPTIRSREACLASSSKAIALARKHGSRLHVLHISTEDELSLFDAGPLESKRITAEACIHHLWFTKENYTEKGALIKWNPAVKKESDRAALRKAVRDNRIDIIATDHAPHTLEEKANKYSSCPSGAPMVQHAYLCALEMVSTGIFNLTQVVEKMCHAPARLFGIKQRGYIREGYFADLVMINSEEHYEVSKKNILYNCGWSPLEGFTFKHKIDSVWINGDLAIKDGEFIQRPNVQKLEYRRF